MIDVSSKELEGWKKALAKSGIKYDTDEEYEEAIHNLVGYFEILIEMDKQQREEKTTILKKGDEMDTDKAKRIYNILDAINTTIINLPLSLHVIDDNSWGRFNASLDELRQGYNDELFLEYKIIPKKIDDGSFYVDRFDYGRKAYQAAYYLHKQYLPNDTIAPRQADYNKQGALMQQNTSQYQNQEQSQAQNQQQSIDQIIETCFKNIEEHYGDEHANQAKELLANVKKEPSKWSNLQKLLTFSANLGKEAFIAILPVLTQVLLSK